MTTDDIRDRIVAMVSHVTFNYRGQDCGVDPLSRTRFDMWCGGDTMTADSIDAVMSTPFFMGKALQDISQDIAIIDW